MAKSMIDVEGEAILADEARIRRTEIAMQNATPRQRATKYKNLMNQLTVARFNINERKRRFLTKIGVI